LAAIGVLLFVPSSFNALHAAEEADSTEKGNTEEKTASDSSKKEEAVSSDTSKKKEGKLEAHFHINDRGVIHVELFPKKAPMTVAQFANLAKREYYNGIVFHRVLANFMIQGGDPTGTGSGGPGYQFGDECVKELVFDKPGLLAMANAGPGTNGSQFFITHGPTLHLNGKHTIFGKVKEKADQDVVDAVKQGDTIEKIEIEGDTAALFESQKENLDKWNKILDKRGH